MAAAVEKLVPPKRIPVNGRPIRLRWLQQVIWSFLAANIGVLIISALYYLFAIYGGYVRYVIAKGHG
jgi:hypothetical protein